MPVMRADPTWSRRLLERHVLQLNSCRALQTLPWPGSSVCPPLHAPVHCPTPVRLPDGLRRERPPRGLPPRRTHRAPPPGTHPELLLRSRYCLGPLVHALTVTRRGRRPCRATNAWPAQAVANSRGDSFRIMSGLNSTKRGLCPATDTCGKNGSENSFSQISIWPSRVRPRGVVAARSHGMAPCSS